MELVDRAQGNGLVQRAADPGDGRTVRVVLTDRGQRMLAVFGPLHRDQMRRMAEALTPPRWGSVEGPDADPDTPRLRPPLPGDELTVRVNAVIYFRVVDPVRVAVDVQDYLSSVGQLAQTSLRSIIGKSDLDDLVAVGDLVAAGGGGPVAVGLTQPGRGVGVGGVGDALVPRLAAGMPGDLLPVEGRHDVLEVGAEDDAAADCGGRGSAFRRRQQRGVPGAGTYPLHNARLEPWRYRQVRQPTTSLPAKAVRPSPTYRQEGGSRRRGGWSGSLTIFRGCGRLE